MQNCAEWGSLPKVVVHAAGSYCDGGRDDDLRLRAAGT
jgi:hypothetical protein